MALAHLIQGDGTNTGNGLRICTDSFTLDDCIKLINVLIIRYRLNVTLHIDSPALAEGRAGLLRWGKYRIYIPKYCMPLLISIISPYMVSSMLYKLGLKV